MVALVGGARLLVGGATDIALALWVNELVVGLTVVVIGTTIFGLLPLTCVYPITTVYFELKQRVR